MHPLPEGIQLHVLQLSHSTPYSYLLSMPIQQATNLISILYIAIYVAL